MGQKIHPTGFRLAVTRDWGSRWFANSKDFAFLRLFFGRIRQDNAAGSFYVALSNFNDNSFAQWLNHRYLPPI